MFFKKVKSSKRKLEIDDLDLPLERKISSHYEEGKNSCIICIYSWAALPPKFLHSQSITYETLQTMEKLLFKSVAWKKCWSWTLAISLLFNNDLDQFKLENQIKTFENIADEKQVGEKEAIKIISSLNASRKLLLSEITKLVKVTLSVPTTFFTIFWKDIISNSKFF